MKNIHIGKETTITEAGDYVILTSSIKNLKYNLTHSRNSIIHTVLCYPGHTATVFRDCKVGDKITVTPFTYGDNEVPFYVKRSKNTYGIKTLIPFGTIEDLNKQGCLKTSEFELETNPSNDFYGSNIQIKLKETLNRQGVIDIFIRREDKEIKLNHLELLSGETEYVEIRNYPFMKDDILVIQYTDNISVSYTRRLIK